MHSFLINTVMSILCILIVEHSAWCWFYAVVAATRKRSTDAAFVTSSVDSGARRLARHAGKFSLHILLKLSFML